MADQKGVEFHEHPGYARMSALADWLWLTVKGGADYKRGKDDHGFEVLPKYDTESKDGHPRRVGATPVLSIAAEFVRARRDGVMRSQIVREQLDNDAREVFATWAGNVDRGGRDLSSFMGSRLYDALVAGEVWLGVDSPSEERLRGLSHGDPDSLPWFKWADTRAVLDYEMEGETCTRVVVETCESKKASITEKAVEVKKAVEWTPTTFELFEQDENGRWQPDGGPQAHGFGRVPWFRLRPLEGEAYAARFADLQRSAVQTRSDMIQEQKANTYTRFVFWGVNPAQIADAAGTASTGFAFADPVGRSERLAGDPAAMKELRENLAADLAEAYRRSELSSASMQKQSSPESGAAIGMRRSELTRLLAGIAERTEQAENQLIRWWAEAAGLPPEEVESLAVSRYPREFDAIAERDRAELLQSLYALEGVPVEVKRAVIRELVTVVWRMDTSQRDTLFASIETMQPTLARQLLGPGRPPVTGPAPPTNQPAFGAPDATAAGSEETRATN